MQDPSEGEVVVILSFSFDLNCFSATSNEEVEITIVNEICSRSRGDVNIRGRVSSKSLLALCNFVQQCLNLKIKAAYLANNLNFFLSKSRFGKSRMS